MFQAVLGILTNCLVYAGVGLGPMALLARGVGLPAVLAMAPAAGYALVSIALTWWLLREGTVETALIPVTGVLAGLSLLCLFLTRQDLRRRLAAVRAKRLLAGLLGAVFCLGLLTAPLATGNKGYAVFRGNASDSFIYIFLARYFDAHPRAWAFSHTPEEVAADDPMLGPPRSMLNIRWTSGAMLAYGAKLAGQGIVAFQYPFTMTSFVLLYAALLALFGAMGLSPFVAALGALVMVTGFYGQLVLDIRAFSQINALPLTVLLAWAISLPPPASGRSGFVLRTGLLGLAYLACFVNYTEIFPMIVGAAAAFPCLLVLAGRLTRRRLAVQLAGLGAGLAATWPVRFLYEHMLAQIHFTEIAPQLWSEAYFTWLFKNIPAGIFGITLAGRGFSNLPGLGFLHIHPVAVTLFALLLAGLFVFGVARALADREHDAPLAAVAFAAASLAAFVLFTLKGKPWVAGKGLSYFYPFTLALPLYAALSQSPLPGRSGRPDWPNRLLPAARALVAAFLVLQLSFACLRPAYAAMDRDYPDYVRNHGRYRVIDCDIDALKQALVAGGAREVGVCASDPWKWTFLGLALGEHWRVRLPGQMLEGTPGDKVFVALDLPKAAGGTDTGLAPYLVAQNASFALYHLPRARLAALAESLPCATVPY